MTHAVRRAAYKEALKINMPTHFWDPLLRVAALGQLGRTSEAQKAIGESLEFRPKFADYPLHYLECHIMQDELVEHVLDGLRKGGLSSERYSANRNSPG